jgi:gluconolactonase
MKRILPLLALTLFGVACTNSTSKKTTASNNGTNGTQTPGPTGATNANQPGGGDPALIGTNPYDNVGDVTPIIETGMFTDGPTWSSQNEGALFFTTPLGEGAIYRMRADGKAIKIRDGVSAQGTTPIGTTVGPDGSIITAEAKRVTTSTSAAIINNAEQPITTGYDPASVPVQTDPYAPPPPPAGNGQFDTLNDVTARKDGTLYVTDPGYFVPGGPAVNRIYRVEPGGHTDVVDAFEDIPHPNGIGLSPDEKLLYVGFSSPTQGTTPYIRKYTVNDDGTLGDQTKFVDLGADSAPDGITIDQAGNVYVATTAGVEAYKPTGEKWGVLAVPEIPTGMAFGGADMKTLYITTQGTHVFQIVLTVPGLNQ